MQVKGVLYMLNYINEFYCATSNGGESVALKLIQADMNILNEKEDGEKVEIASVVMDRSTALQLALQLAEIMPEITIADDEESK